MTVLCVYVPRKSKANLEVGIRTGTWGWKDPTIGLAKKEPGWKGIGVGDYLLLGHIGVHRKEMDIADVSVGRVYVTRVVAALYSDSTGVWQNDVYPNRVRFEVLGAYDQVGGLQIGQGAVDALRRSSIIHGAPVPDLSNLSVDRLAGTVDESGAAVSVVEPPSPDDSVVDLPDDLDRSARVMVRREQKKLRNLKFQGAPELNCALCGRLLPEALVHTAHVKKRSAASYPERCDLANIMGACVLGCDSLFELGYIHVSADGKIHPTDHSSRTPDLYTAAEALDGQVCAAFGVKSADYFAWHRVNIAGVSE